MVPSANPGCVLSGATKPSHHHWLRASREMTLVGSCSKRLMKFSSRPSPSASSCPQQDQPLQLLCTPVGPPSHATRPWQGTLEEEHPTTMPRPSDDAVRIQVSLLACSPHQCSGLQLPSHSGDRATVDAWKTWAAELLQRT